MWKRPLIRSFIFVLTLATFVSCFNKEREKNEQTSNRLSQKSWRIWTFDDVVVINLIGIISEIDTFDVHEVIGANFANSDTLKIKFLTGYDIVSAEKNTRYYPTIWSGTNDSVMQFIYLFNLCYSDTLSLNIRNGMIEYPLRRNAPDPDYRQYFGNITQHQLHASIDRVPGEYSLKNSSLVYEAKSWKSEAEVWKQITGGYTSGELIDEENEPFDVDPYEIRLVVTLNKGDSLFTKIFCDKAVIGN